MNFDAVAGVYDRLARIVFGKQWEQMQLTPLKYIDAKDEVLIVGGGTGVILEEMVVAHITYVESSVKMLDQAKLRSTQSAITFIQRDFLVWESTQLFDVIYCPFFLDCFDNEQLNMVLEQLKNRLHPNGRLIVLDFQRAGCYYKILTRLMLLFFRVTSHLQAKRLLPIDQIIQTKGFVPVNSKVFMKNWVFCHVYLSE